MIAWRSLPGADVDNAGSVWFKEAPAGRGTEVRVELQYNPPAGALGALIAQMWGKEPGQQIQEDLHRLKQIMEAGEIPTTEGQPTRPLLARARRATATSTRPPSSPSPPATRRRITTKPWGSSDASSFV